MLKNYNHFILETKIPTLVLEGQFSASLEFTNRLKQIAVASKVAGELYRLFEFELDVDKDLNQNYIDVTDKDDVITFISDTRADRLSDDTSPYLTSGRGEIKVGRFARAILGDADVRREIGFTTNFTDKDYENFVNFYKATNVKISNEFKLVNGKTIGKYYLDENYASTKGELGNSCMKYETCQDYFGIYEDNKDKVSMLVYLDSQNMVLGRALVWKLEKSPCEATHFMDRIYTASDSDRLKFIEYANSNGWMYKYKNNSDIDFGLFFKYKGQIVLGESRVKLKDISFEEYPYVDTLRFLNKKEKTLSNVGSAKMKILNDTSGDTDKCWECIDGIADSVDCIDCNGTGDVTCKKCEGTGKKDSDKGKTESNICKKCDGDGIRDCKTCDGQGEGKGPCPECEGFYLNTLKHSNFPSELQPLVDAELQRMLLEKSYRPK